MRETSREAVAELHELGVRTLMLTGDNPHTAAAIAAQVGIDEALGNLLPEDKRAKWNGASRAASASAWWATASTTRPPWPRADIGFAMGAAGTDTAIETAGVALMDDDLRKLPLFIRLSRRTHAVLVQNIVLALGIKALFAPSPWPAWAPCGWPCSPTWARACWWCSTGCGCCAGALSEQRRCAPLGDQSRPYKQLAPP